MTAAPLRAAGAGLAAAARGMTRLTNVQLAGCSSINDAGLALGIARMAQLRVLNLRCCGGFTDLGLGQLAALTRLQELSVAGNRNISSRCVPPPPPSGASGRPICIGLWHLDRPEHCVLWRADPCLMLACCRGLSQLAGLRHLTSLDVSMCWGVDEAALQALVPLPRLSCLDCRYCWRITDAGEHPSLVHARRLRQEGGARPLTRPRAALLLCPPAKSRPTAIPALPQASARCCTAAPAWCG
jgi:hypothetical protein